MNKDRDGQKGNTVKQIMLMLHIVHVIGHILDVSKHLCVGDLTRFHIAASLQVLHSLNSLSKSFHLL